MPGNSTQGYKESIKTNLLVLEGEVNTDLHGKVFVSDRNMWSGDG